MCVLVVMIQSQPDSLRSRLEGLRRHRIFRGISCYWRVEYFLKEKCLLGGEEYVLSGYI